MSHRRGNILSFQNGIAFLLRTLCQNTFLLDKKLLRPQHRVLFAFLCVQIQLPRKILKVYRSTLPVAPSLLNFSLQIVCWSRKNWHVGYYTISNSAQLFQRHFLYRSYHNVVIFLNDHALKYFKMNDVLVKF